MITIALVDDHLMVREGLRALLTREADFEVVGEASTGQEATEMAARLRPNILITDMLMPGMNGLEVTRFIRERLPQVNVLILSMCGTESYVVKALRNGAAGYVLKEARINVLFQAIRAVAAGERYLSPSLSRSEIDSSLQQTAAEPTDMAADPHELLTDREREIFQLAAEGRNNVEIGNLLRISPRTVEIHRLNMMRKLKLRNQTELVRYALRRGAVLIED